MSVPRSRILDLMKAQCRIFSTVYNPENLRLGTKVLRQRLRGPSIASYYPAAPPAWSKIRKTFAKLGATIVNDQEEARLEKLEELRQRGKGQWQSRRGTTGTGKKKR